MKGGEKICEVAVRFVVVGLFVVAGALVVVGVDRCALEREWDLECNGNAACSAKTRLE